jgi:Arabinose efflux permease
MSLFARLDASIRALAGASLPAGDAGDKRVAGLRFFYLDGLFASLSDNLVLGFLELFLLSYGVSNGIIGLNTSIANLFASVSIIPGAMAISKARSRKRLVVITGGGIGRLCLLGIALVPLAVGDSRAAVVCLVCFNAIRTTMNNFNNPAWTSMVADLVPIESRARYFSKRNIAVILASIAAAPIAGYLVKVLSGVRGMPHLGFQSIFLLSFLVGLLSTVSFANIPNAAVSESSATRPRGFPLKALLSDRRFAGFVASALVWNIAIQIAAPFFNVYLVSGLSANAAVVGFLTAVASIFTFFGQLLFGPVTDKKGDVFVLVLTGILIPLLPLAWLLVTDWRQVIAINVLSGLAWAGYNLANFNILLKLTPNDHRPEATAIYQTVVTASAVLGPIIGGQLADARGYMSVFAVSGVGRIVGILLFVILVVRPGPWLRGKHR